MSKIKKDIPALLIFFVGMLFCVFQVKAQVGFPYCETFQDNSTQSATVLGGGARLENGVLQLTSNERNQSGYVYIDIPFSSVFGIKTSFEYFSYGGTGADGLTMFLFDATTSNFAPGGFGGSLGYAQRDGEPGLTGAYLGIGFDSFGNFGNSNEGRNGSFPNGEDQLHPNSIVIRGASSGPISIDSGYPFINGLKTNETGANGLPPDQLFSLSSGGVGTQRVTDPNVPGYRKVFINLEPRDLNDFFLTLEMIYTTTPGNPRLITLFEKVSYPFIAPADLKIGFAASTGGETNFHEIRNLIVQVSNEDALLNPSAVDIFDKASCEGQENTYEIFSSDINLPNENSEIRCLQLYSSMEEMEAEDADICAQGKCRPENREMILPQGTFRAADEGGKFTFFPNYGFTDQQVTIYYTVTDSYGKTSAGNAIQLLIQESPEPVTLRVENYPVGDSEIRRCQGDGVLLHAIGEETYVRFEWLKDDVIIPGSNSPDYFANEAGEYKVIAYNSKSCPTKSLVFKLINPAFPELKIEDPVVECTPGMTIDVREFILEFNEDDFDYRLRTSSGQFLINNEMSSVGLSGVYQISVKHKDLDCWSDPIDFELVINSEVLKSSFVFEVDGTGITGDDEGGIFIDDAIRFVDKSEGNIIKWDWDFGDGGTSSETSPIHVFGKKGVFFIVLKVTNDLGCESTFELEMPITLSYRVMLPTGFTPNDRENQFFRPKTKGIVKMELLVFTMWGELIFQTDDLNTAGWDGRINNELFPAGNYVYKANMESVDGEKVIRSGNFMLIR